MEKTSSDLAYLILDVYRPILRETVKFSHLVSRMPFMREIAAKIHKMDMNQEYGEAAEIFFEYFASVDEEGKFMAFMNALEQSKYELILHAINRGGVEYHHEEHKRLMELFTDRLSESIDCFDMAQKLQARGLILHEDQVKICKLLRNESHKNAAFYLLDTLPRYKEDWFSQFMELLVEDGQDHIVEEIDPKLFANIKHTKTDESDDTGNCDQRLGLDKVQTTVQTGEFKSEFRGREDDGSSTDISNSANIEESTEKCTENMHEKMQDFMQKVNYSLEEQKNQLVLLNEKVDKIAGMLQTLIEK